MHVRDECAARVKQAGASFGVEYLLAGACALNGEIERAHQTLLALGDKLAAAKRWEPLAAVAERALDLEETHAAARLLVSAHEGLKVDPARLDALERAWAINPDDLELALLLAVRLGDAGRGSHRRALLAELLDRFATDARYTGLEEAALEFAEQDDADGLVRDCSRRCRSSRSKGRTARRRSSPRSRSHRSHGRAARARAWSRCARSRRWRSSNSARRRARPTVSRSRRR